MSLTSSAGGGKGFSLVFSAIGTLSCGAPYGSRPARSARSGRPLATSLVTAGSRLLGGLAGLAGLAGRRRRDADADRLDVRGQVLGSAERVDVRGRAGQRRLVALH